MKKTDKKTEQTIVRALTEVCHWAQDQCSGFDWLTHQVDFKHFPASLKVTCVFHTCQQQQQLDSGPLKTQIIKTLGDNGIALKPGQIHLDNEQDCAAEHQGDWARRLSRH